MAPRYKFRLYFFAASTALLAAFSALATPTPILKTVCTWQEPSGKLTRQSCQVWGNSSAGAGTSFHIQWKDGVETRILSQGSGYVTNSGRAAKLYGQFEWSRMRFPRKIQIEGLGTLTIAPVR